jgi:hypothetical protein
MKPSPGASRESGVVVARIRGKGRGLMAGRRFGKDEVVMSNPVLVIPAEDWQALQETILADYCFIWHDHGEDAALALGLGSLLNHSYWPNVICQKRLRERVLEFVALHDIEEGEEITLNYHGDPGSREELHFEVKDRGVSK